MKADYDRIAEIYDLYVKTDYDFAFFLSEAGKTQGPVIELAAGTGRLSLPLIETGVRLTCVDSSQGMLDILTRKLRERGLSAEIHRTDICHLDLPPRFDLAILPFQSFMEIVGEKNQRDALSSVFACLKPGGRFICTLHNPAVRRSLVDENLHEVGEFPTPDGRLVVSGLEHGGHPVVTRHQFFEFFGRDGKLREKLVFPMEFAFVERETFESMARNAGFRVVDLYGTYDRAPYDPVNSPVMIWILEKPLS